jgi:hypothetical protein
MDTTEIDAGNAPFAQVMAWPAADMKGMPFSRISDLVLSAVVLGGLAAGLFACGTAAAAASHPAAAPGDVRVTVTVTATPKATHRAIAVPKTPAATAAAAGPALLVVPAVYGGPAYSGIEPQYVQFSGDAGNVVAAISWSTWTATKATGTGTVDIQGCVPDCASGSETPTPAYLVLSDPVNGKFTAIAEYVDGRNDATMWPEIVDQADPAGEPEPARSTPAAASNGLPATGVWYPVGFPNVACGPPISSAAFPNPDGLNTSYLQQGSSYIVDGDDPTSSPCNS